MDLGFWIVIGYFYLIYFIVVCATTSTPKTEEELSNRNKFVLLLESIWNWISKIIGKGTETLRNGVKYLIDLMKVQR